MKTKATRKNEVERNWLLVDAAGVRLGKLACFVSKLLQGKNKPYYTSHIDCGDYVVLINSKRVDFHPSRAERKIYRRHSGYPGGLKSVSLGELMAKNSNDVIRRAVRGMMPKTKLGRSMMKKLYIYEEEQHKHSSQKPKLVEIK